MSFKSEKITEGTFQRCVQLYTSPEWRDTPIVKLRSHYYHSNVRKVRRIMKQQMAHHAQCNSECVLAVPIPDKTLGLRMEERTKSLSVNAQYTVHAEVDTFLCHCNVESCVLCSIVD
jgi:hypothetical protein